MIATQFNFCSNSLKRESGTFGSAFSFCRENEGGLAIRVFYNNHPILTCLGGKCSRKVLHALNTPLMVVHSPSPRIRVSLLRDGFVDMVTYHHNTSKFYKEYISHYKSCLLVVCRSYRARLLLKDGNDVSIGLL